MIFSVSNTENTTQETTSKMIDFSQLEIVDFVRSGALLVAFLATAFVYSKRGDAQRVWATADYIGILLFGFGGLFFPTTILEYQMSGKPDAVHSWMFQGLNVFLISIGVTRYWSASTQRKDNAVNAAFILSRLFGSLDLFLIMAFQYWRTRDMSLQHLTFSMLAVGLWFVGNLMQLLQFENLGRRGSHIVLNSALNRHILFDLLMFGIACVIYHCQPNMFYDLVGVKNFKGDTMHLYLIRALGSLVFTTLIHGMSALYFENDEDKKHHFLGRIVFYAVMMPLATLAQVRIGLYKYPVFMAITFLIGAGNSLLGYYGDKLHKD